MTDELHSDELDLSVDLVSGAHFNPAVTIARTLSDTFAGIAPVSASMFIGMQLFGAVIAFGLVRLFHPHKDREAPDD